MLTIKWCFECIFYEREKEREKERERERERAIVNVVSGKREAATGNVMSEKEFLKILQNSQESTCA